MSSIAGCLCFEARDSTGGTVTLVETSSIVETS